MKHYALEVVEGLAARGHETVVLTSMYGVDHEVIEENVHRLLALEGDLQFYQNRRCVELPSEKPAQSIASSPVDCGGKAGYRFHLGYVEHVETSGAGGGKIDGIASGLLSCQSVAD